jgi:hypothetical protein
MSERPEEALEWLELYHFGYREASDITDYITHIEAELAKAQKDVARLDYVLSWAGQNFLDAWVGADNTVPPTREDVDRARGVGGTP